ncbi:hypothetical protein BB559_003543 [Furculomyces boomerangus]|uniref:Uncharacterized protein n=1 Tax=Furculomyces boomerangus TaxID=61424 RepID=A0A2T9YKQ7_9FUNG|nr:hypothetical protein BB559_007042 [Furculomyces boomerangus]PVU85663.1 hypothetical protein BB559_006874 [Furculomyces boomerangus]PVU92921.1 hypothetical protein BB559_003543 [Furculomyces boomerangus]
MKFKTGNDSALDTVVRNLMKASVGGDFSAVDDSNLDNHISKLLEKEAREKYASYEQMGFEAFAKPRVSSGPPRTNKWFLNTLLSQTKRHNDSVIDLQNPKSKNVERLEQKEYEEDSSHKRRNVSKYVETKSPENRTIKVRGRGLAGSSRMDRYFQEDYDPKEDYEELSHLTKGNSLISEELVDAYSSATKKRKEKNSKKEKSKKSHKRHKSHKEKSRKHHSDNSDESENK